LAVLVDFLLADADGLTAVAPVDGVAELPVLPVPADGVAGVAGAAGVAWAKANETAREAIRAAKSFFM
jgi:hypothetical protein